MKFVKLADGPRRILIVRTNSAHLIILHSQVEKDSQGGETPQGGIERQRVYVREKGLPRSTSKGESLIPKIEFKQKDPF